jgi:peptidoglycan hydrolase-like protein with peptidoglycan-binding domain
MKAKGLIASAAVAAVMVVPAGPVLADRTRDAIMGIGIEIIRRGLEDSGRPPPPPPGPGVRDRGPTQAELAERARREAQREQNRQVQTALNHFGYNAGPIDGVPGNRTRAAIGQFEAEMGFYADQNLDDAEREFLLSSYQRAILGNIGPHGQAMATGGPRGLLRSFNDERTGRFAGHPGGGLPPPPPGGTVGHVQVPTPPMEVSFPEGIDLAPQQSSMAQYCSETAQMTAVNGGPQGITGLTNAGQALGEQFCMARDFSAARGDQRVAAVQGRTSADIRATCDQVEAALAPATGALADGTPETAIAAAKGITTGRSTVDMVNLGEICLGIGYTDDKPALSLASALLLVAADKVPYAEIVGHHLQAGFGTAANPAAASGWFGLALAAADQGMPAEILPAQAERRNAVIRAALGSPIQASTGLGGALPTLVVSPAP